MESLLIGSFLIIVGFLSATMGYVLFRVLLPFLGFIAGFSIGFGGVVGMFGANAASYTVAIVTAFLFGVLFASLAYAYYSVAVIFLGASLGAGLLALLGQAVGLREEGFIMFLMSVTGTIMGGLTVVRNGLQHSLIIYLTSLYGVGLMLLAAFMIVGDQTSSSLYETGLTNAVTDVVTRSWLWVLAWLGGGLFAAYTQMSLIKRAVFTQAYIINESKQSKKATK